MWVERAVEVCSQVEREGVDQFASRTRCVGFAVWSWGSQNESRVLAEGEVVVEGLPGLGAAAVASSRMSMSAMAITRSFFASLTHTYCAVRLPGRTLMPVLSRPSAESASSAALPDRSSPMELQRRTGAPARWAARATLCATPPSDCLILAGLEVCKVGSLLAVDEMGL